LIKHRVPSAGRHRTGTDLVPFAWSSPVSLARRAWLRAWALIVIGSASAASSISASWLEWLVYWPGLEFALSRTATAVRSAARWVARIARRLVDWSGWSRLTRLACTVDRFARRRTPVVLRHVGRVLWWVTVRVSRVLRWMAVRVWRWAEPSLRDAAGWLVHTAPRLFARWAGRMLARFLGWAPGALLRMLGWAGIGAGWLVARVVIYCATYPEYAAMIREARELDKPRRVHALQMKWRRAAGRRTGLFVVLGLLGWLGWTLAVDRFGLRAEVMIMSAGVIMLAILGRAVKPAKERDPDAPEEPVDENAPYPIADANTRAEAADCVARALGAENIALRMAGEAVRTEWGWEIPVILRAGTPTDIVAKTGNLETHLDLPAGGLLATPDQSRRARVVLRLAQQDPFLRLGDAVARGPRSATIATRAVVGRRIDGDALTVPLLGVHGVVIGSPGGGKSSTLLALADAVTACVDAVAWDLDPAGYGLDALGDAVGRRERDTAGIEDALADAVALAEARPKMLRALGMTSAWEPSPERPAVVVFCDEYPRLSNRAKESAVNLLRIGRKSRVTLILAATEATADALGAAIADTTALRILHACRNTDVRLVLGPQMAAEGWRPDRLRPATADDPGDVGRCYVATAGSWEPLVSKIAPVWEGDAIARGQQRAAAGMPRIDAESWERARARRATGTGTDRAASGPVLDRTVLSDVVAVFGPDARLWTDEILSRLAALDDRYTGWSAEDLAGTLRPWGVSPRQVRIGAGNRNGYHRADLETARANPPDDAL
jgi:S-DNA-T family DNA segregation ATPase FtsK/SpoIIIE